MGTSSAPLIALPSATTSEAARTGSRKAFRRLTGFLVLCYILSYLDRSNIGYAVLTMADDLALTATVFGIASSIFYFGYAGFEVPSNLACAKFGPRAWISRIMITWGIASCLTLFAVGPYSLYFLRFLVGAAEAGLLPGVILYLSYWFTQKDRARANSIFVMGMPLALLLGAPISGLILQMDGILGLKGWQWLFLLEGMPSILLGIAALYFLVDRPTEAKWLTREEGEAMERAVAAENAATQPDGDKFRWRDLFSPILMLLTIPYFCNVANNNTLGTWTPLVVKEVLDTDNVLTVSLVSAIPALFAVISVPLWSWSSDRSQERRLHLGASLIVAAAGWVTMALSPLAIVKLIGLVMAYVGGYSFVAIFWALAVPMLTPASRPAAIALISTTGLMASIVSPTVIGLLRDFTNSFTAAFWFIAGLNMLGIIVLAILVNQARRHVPRLLV